MTKKAKTLARKPKRFNGNNSPPGDQPCQTPWVDRFFRVTRKVTHLTLGSDFQTIGDHFTVVALNYDDYREVKVRKYDFCEYYRAA
jgi:hypothetical protein